MSSLETCPQGSQVFHHSSSKFLTFKPTIHDATKLHATVACNFVASCMLKCCVQLCCTVYVDCCTQHCSSVAEEAEGPTPSFSRWLMELEEIPYQIRYRPGSQNQLPDYLSRKSVLRIDGEVNCEDHFEEKPA